MGKHVHVLTTTAEKAKLGGKACIKTGNYTVSLSTVLHNQQPYLCHSLQASVQSVTAHSKIRFIELILLSPSKRSVAQPLLDDGMEPGQQEVEPGSLMRFLAHPRGWDSAEGADEISLDARWGFKCEDSRASQEIDWDL